MAVTAGSIFAAKNLPKCIYVCGTILEPNKEAYCASPDPLVGWGGLSF